MAGIARDIWHSRTPQWLCAPCTTPAWCRRCFPEWENITCLVVPDYYHRYTVDEHTLVAIERLAELAHTKDHARLRFAEILSEIADQALLRFALLFHDSGKGDNSGDHSRRSVELARQAMRAHSNAGGRPGPRGVSD